MENHISKRLLAGVCALSATFILASCDPITATPVNYNDAIVNNKDNQAVDLDENKLGKIYDAIATDRNTKIVSDLLDEVAEKKFGTYAEIADAATDPAKMVAYMEAHKEVFHRSDDNNTEIHLGKTEAEVRQNRFETFWNDIQDRISEAFWNEITSGTYNDDEGRFDESKFWMAHYYEFYDISGWEGAEKNAFFVTGEYNRYRVFRDGYLKGNYSNPDKEKRGYIEKKVFPQILKDKLVEEYVYNTNKSALGRAYARKVNYIKVSYEDHAIPWDILKSFGDNYVESNATLDFEIVAKALKGFEKAGKFTKDSQGIFPLDDSSASNVLLKGALKELDKTEKDTRYHTSTNGVFIATDIKFGTDVVLVPNGWYYKDTKLGEILVSYNKAICAELDGRFPISGEKGELDKFTSSGKSKEYGLREKLISLAKEDYTTDGWFVKNGGLSELPSAIRDRLFNINVANTLDDGSLVLEDNSGEGHMLGDYEKVSGNRVPYLRNIFGKKFVIPAKISAYKDNKYNYIYQDKDGKAFYMVQVEEAPSTPKLNDQSATAYWKLPGAAENPYKAEQIARAVAKVLGTKDSYIKDAYTTYLKNYTFTFYETSLYEHFKSEYPDLFDEE